MKIIFSDQRTGEGEAFHYKRGIIEFVEYLNRASEAAHDEVIYIAGEYEGVGLEVALQYSAEFTENVHTYVNNICTIEGGTHLSGFRAALTRTLNNYGKKENLFKDLVPTGEDFREGLTAVISLRVPEPQFEGQTKTKLGNSEIEGIVNSAVGDYLARYFEENPKTAKHHRPEGPAGGRGPRERPQGPASWSASARARSPAAGCPASSATAPAATSNRCELYLVEGDSAGGSAEGGRLREYQAILPLRGKIINAYKSRDDKVLANEEVRSIISAIGSRHRRGNRPHQAPLRQDRHHDRRRRRRLAHPHAAARPSSTGRCTTWSAAGTSTSPSRRCSACGTRRNLLRPDRRGDEGPTAGGRPEGRRLRAGRRPHDRRRAR